MFGTGQPTLDGMVAALNKAKQGKEGEKVGREKVEVAKLFLR